MGEGQGWFSFFGDGSFSQPNFYSISDSHYRGQFFNRTDAKKDRNVFEEFLSLKSCLTEVQTFIYAPLFEDAEW